MSTVEAPKRQLTADEKILNNMGLVGSLAKRISQSTGTDYSELFQEGSIGLIKAARSFKESKGYKFATYANKCIQNHMIDYLRKGWRDIQCDSLDTIPDWWELVGQYDPDMTFIEIDQEALRSIQGKQRQALVLLLKGYNQQEAAIEMGVTQTYVSKLVVRARSSYELASGFKI